MLVHVHAPYRGAIVARAFVKGGATGPEAVPTPHAVSRKERIFLDPEAIDPSIFRTVSQTGCRCVNRVGLGIHVVKGSIAGLRGW